VGRRYEDAVHVQEAADGTAGPSAFLWHERLYVIREVLGHWHERAAWWDGPAARAARGEDAAVAVAPAAGAQGAGREVWRVAASAGRQCATGTYDLGRSGSASEWRLLQVVD
jgi:hypothetical protein